MPGWSRDEAVEVAPASPRALDGGPQLAGKK